MVTPCLSVVQYHNQEIDIDTTYSIQFSPVLCALICVCVYLILCFIMCVDSGQFHHDQDTEQLHHKDPFYSYAPPSFPVYYCYTKCLGLDC